MLYKAYSQSLTEERIKEILGLMFDTEKVDTLTSWLKASSESLKNNPEGSFRQTFRVRNPEIHNILSPYHDEQLVLKKDSIVIIEGAFSTRLFYGLQAIKKICVFSNGKTAKQRFEKRGEEEGTHKIIAKIYAKLMTLDLIIEMFKNDMRNNKFDIIVYTDSIENQELILPATLPINSHIFYAKGLNNSL